MHNDIVSCSFSATAELIVYIITLLQVECFGCRLLQSAKLAASEFGLNRAASANGAEETSAAENGNDDDDAGDDDDDDERAERNVDYDADEEEKADLSDSAELGLLWFISYWQMIYFVLQLTIYHSGVEIVIHAQLTD